MNKKNAAVIGIITVMSGVLGDVFKPKIMVLIGLSAGRD